MSRQTSEMTPISGPAQDASVKPQPEQIAALAYQMWLERGSPAGDDQQDWFQAEAQLREALSVPRAA